MNNDRQKILTDYISYLYTTGRTYDTVGKYIKYVTDFLERTEDVNRRGYLVYKRENADVMVRHSLMCSAICDLLSYLNIGYGKRGKAVKPLEKLDVISDKNKKQLNDFIIWLTDNNDYSSHTVYIYYTSMKKYFEYANEVNMDNCRRFIKSLEEEKLSPATIRLRITAIESCVIDRSIYNDEYQPYYLDGFKDGAEWQSKQSPWVSVKERLPEENKEYLVVLDNRVVYVAQYNKNNKSWLIYGTGYTYNVVVAYMPIPSFDEILEANRDVLERIKQKGD